MTTLTAAHLFITAGVMEAACKCGKLFEEKGVEPRPRVQFSVINGLSVGFLNLSLAFNSVGCGRSGPRRPARLTRAAGSTR